MATSDQDPTLNFELILLALLFLLLVTISIGVHLGTLVLVHKTAVFVLNLLGVLGLGLLINVHLLFLFFLVWDI